MASRGLTTVTASADTLEEAHEIAGRLTQAGFARNSIHVARQGEDSFEISLHVREANRARAERAIGSLGGPNLAAFSAPGLAIGLGIGAAAIGAGIFAALAARRYAPRYLRDGAEAAPAAREG